MAAIKDVNFFAPGKIVYHVYGHLVNDKSKLEDQMRKHICISRASHFANPHLTKPSDSLSVATIVDGFRGNDHKTSLNMHDCGMGPTIYNLNRVFATVPDALDFIIQCLTGVFDDPMDQEHYNRTNTPAYKRQQEEDRKWLYSMDW